MHLESLILPLQIAAGVILGGVALAVLLAACYFALTSPLRIDHDDF